VTEDSGVRFSVTFQPLEGGITFSTGESTFRGIIKKIKSIPKANPLMLPNI
jgi:hypothetical protein